MSQRLGIGCIVTILSLWAGSVSAAAERYIFDEGHTRIFFEVDHLGFSKYRGMFHDYDGFFIFDPDNLEKSRIEVTVDISSADMYYAKMNEHLLAEDILDAKQYPQAKFVSTKVQKAGNNGATVKGDLTLHGVTLPITLDVQFNKAGEHPYSKKFIRGFTATGVIDRTKFGIGYAAPMVSAEVDLTIAVEGIRVDD